MADVNFTVDGKKLTAPAGTLLIEACRSHGIEVPAFCYYPKLAMRAACRMCHGAPGKSAQAADCLHHAGC